jgi:cysteine synthase
VSAAPFLEFEWAEKVRRQVQSLLDRHPRSMLSLIGKTQLIELTSVNRHERVAMFAKLEGQNPAGSIKDRLALYLVADAMVRGKLGPGMTLVEASSGNTGIALAMICARLGVRLVITVAENVSVERFKLMTAYGAELVLTPGSQGTCGAIEKARELGERPDHYWVAQHFNHVNSFAHYETTGVEIVEQVRALGERPLSAFVATSGTTGTLMGISARLKETFPEVEVVSVWPKDSIMGIRRPEGDKRPGIYDEQRIDRVVEVTGADAIVMKKELARSEGVLVGPSGGAAVIGALEAAKRLEQRAEAGLVLVLLPDWGERYLSLDATSFRA